MSRLVRRTVRWKHRGDDEVRACTYVMATHHDHKAEAKAVNDAAEPDEQLAVVAYNNATTAGSAVIVDIDTVEVTDGSS